MHDSILLEDGRIIDPASDTDRPGSLLIRDGRIAGLLEPGATLPEEPSLARIPLGGAWVVPGLVDLHVHLREPGQEHKETIASGTAAAVAGGFTAVAAMPNTLPVNDCQAVTRFILERAAGCPARVYPVAAISQGSRGEALAEYGELARNGAKAVSDDGRPVSDSQLMRRALEYARGFGLLVISHAEDLALSRNGAMNEGEVSTRLGLQGIPAAAEAVMVYRDCLLAGLTGSRLHIAHLSAKESVAVVRWAKDQGFPVTAETAPHYFTLTEEAAARYDTHAKMNPPLRTPADVAAIIEGLQDGTIDAIATDHAPHCALDKDVEFQVAASGIIGLETALPLTLALVAQGLISPRRAVELLSQRPAAILGVEGGQLAVGAPADVTVIDPDRRYPLTREILRSKSANSPFLGWELTGRAILTIRNGRIVHDDRAA
ncbi:MAG: dihydroorotase [Thermodesulfobacteriota bacterium]